MKPHKGWQKQECVDESIRVAWSNIGSSEVLGGGDSPQYGSARNTTAVRAGKELSSKREQEIRALQKLGFCRISCVKGLDVGKGDMGITLKHMLQGRIRETVPVVKMGSGHRMLLTATGRVQSRGRTVKDSATKLNDPRHALARRLGERGLDLVPVTQDNNSQFRAVAQQVFGVQSVHNTLRALACELIRTHSEYFETHIKELYPRLSSSQYLALMQGDAAGDVLTLQALAGLLRVEFQTVVGSDKHDTHLPMAAALSQEGSGQDAYTLACHEGPGGLKYYSASTAKKVGTPLTPLQIALEGIDNDALGKVCGILKPLDTIPSGSGIEISRRTLESLRDTKWLKSDVINWFCEWWGERSGGSVNRKPYVKKAGYYKCHFLNTYFYAKLMEKGRFSHVRVKKWTNKIDVFNIDKVILPCNLNNSHWVVAVLDNNKKRIEILDSLGGENVSLK
jgi:hypothetical protein